MVSCNTRSPPFSPCEPGGLGGFVATIYTVVLTLSNLKCNSALEPDILNTLLNVLTDHSFPN
jgi:hypothetical protein